MKKSLLLIALVALFLLSVTDANAKIRRVGYFGTSVGGTDYITVQEAHNAAIAGDTLLIFPGNYGVTYFAKKLTVIGYGYWLTGAGANPDLQVIAGSLNLEIRLQNGSDSTVFEGLDGLALVTYVSTSLNGIIIKRCSGYIRYSNSTYTGWQITQSNISSVNNQYSGGGVFKNLLISNCIISNINLNNLSAAGNSGVFKNNIFGTAGVAFNNGAYTLTNNVFLSTTAPSGTTNCIFKNNIASNNTIPTGNGNQPDVNIGAVFQGYPTQGIYSNDGRYQLATGSPAKGTGEGGTDCGIYGGNDPYHRSGIPPVPSFYKLTAPSTTTSSNPYTITFSVRSNN
jgi:hypothetical protein